MVADVDAVELGLGVALAAGDADAFADVLAFGDADVVALGLASFADSAAVDALTLPAAFAELLGVGDEEAVGDECAAGLDVGVALGVAAGVVAFPV